MKIRRMFFEEHAMGITSRSLKILRDELIARFRDRICVVEIPTNALCCGFLILDATDGSATFTGDGFRTDRGGEGGAGYRSAQALFLLFHVHLSHWDTVDLSPIIQAIADREFHHRSDTPHFSQVARDIFSPIAEEICDSEFQILHGLEPEYVRCL